MWSWNIYLKVILFPKNNFRILPAFSNFLFSGIFVFHPPFAQLLKRKFRAFFSCNLHDTSREQTIPFSVLHSLAFLNPCCVIPRLLRASSRPFQFTSHTRNTLSLRKVKPNLYLYLFRCLFLFYAKIQYTLLETNLI